METSDPHPEVQDPAPGTGPGGRLVAAREARGLTLTDVSRKLRLPEATIQALESSRYEGLPEPIYVRGYLRAYARLLEMDEEMLVAEYGRLVDMPEPVLKPTTAGRRQAPARDSFIRGTGALIVVAMVVLLGSWLYSRLEHDNFARSLTVIPEVEAPASTASVLTPPQIDTPDPDSGPVGAVSPDNLPETQAGGVAGESMTVVESGLPMVEAAAVSGPVLPVDSESPATAAVDVDAVVQAGDFEPAREPAVAELPIAPLASERGQLVRASRAPAGEDVLVIRTNEESWADVVDANGYQLLYYLLRPETVQTLQGQAPFRVFLGNAPAVDLSLNRERFDHTPFHRRNNTAVFSVDEHL